MLSQLNHRFSAASDRVHMLRDGRILDLSQFPSVLSGASVLARQG